MSADDVLVDGVIVSTLDVLVPLSFAAGDTEGPVELALTGNFGVVVVVLDAGRV